MEPLPKEKLGYVVYLHVKCNRLYKNDAHEKVSPVCVMCEGTWAKGQDRQTIIYREVDRTDKIVDDDHPVWPHVFKRDYSSSEERTDDDVVKFQIYNHSEGKTKFEDCDLIGYVDNLKIHKLVYKDEDELKGTLTRWQLKKPNGGSGECGELEITTEVSAHRYVIHGKVTVKKLNFPKNAGKKLEPYLVLYQKVPVREDGKDSVDEVPIYRSKVMFKSENDEYRHDLAIPLVLNERKAIHEMKFDLMGHLKGQKDVSIGSASWIIRQASQPRGTRGRDTVVDPKKPTQEWIIRLKTMQVKERHGGSFQLHFDKIQSGRLHTFQDFREKDINIDVMTAIDFSYSNEKWHAPGEDGKLNIYEQCLRAVVHPKGILGELDTDLCFKLFGFGAAKKDSDGIPGPTEHFFILSGTGEINAESMRDDKTEFEDDAEMMKSINNDLIISAYRRVRDNWVCAGPSLMAPVVKHAFEQACADKKVRKKETYYVLLIITDGQIDDLQSTIDQIVAVSEKRNDEGGVPLSIVIIGIGDNDFQKMEVLDGDDAPLFTTQDWKAAREMMSKEKSNATIDQHKDIVQFVRFHPREDGRVLTPNEIKTLKRNVLDEIPKQVEEYILSKQDKL